VFDPTSSSRQVVAELQAERRATTTTQRLAGRLLLLLLPLYYDVISTPNCPDVCHVIRHHHHHHRDRRHRPPTSLSLSLSLDVSLRVSACANEDGALAEFSCIEMCDRRRNSASSRGNV